jgi:hypothetical protein
MNPHDELENLFTLICRVGAQTARAGVSSKANCMLLPQPGGIKLNIVRG